MIDKDDIFPKQSGDDLTKGFIPTYPPSPSGPETNGYIPSTSPPPPPPPPSQASSTNDGQNKD